MDSEWKTCYALSKPVKNRIESFAMQRATTGMLRVARTWSAAFANAKAGQG